MRKMENKIQVSGIIKDDDLYLPDGEFSFPGPLMSRKIPKDDVLRFIRRKSQECLQQVKQPDQVEAFIFWKMMELYCRKNGKLPLADLGTVLRKSSRFLRTKLKVKFQVKWCPRLVKLLRSAETDYEILDAVVEMGEELESRGLTYPAHLCYIAAMKELEHCGFELIGCNSLPVSQSAMREAIERTEVYEYVYSLVTECPQPTFQIFKCLHANKLAELGLFDYAYEYCQSIAAAISSSLFAVPRATMEMTITLSEMLNEGMEEEPQWLQDLCELYRDEMYKPTNSSCSLMTSEMLYSVRPYQKGHITPWEVFESLYTPGELLGEGGFGTVRAGVRKADGKQVAIKYIGKERNEEFITIPGDTKSLPLEVALMQMVSKVKHENVLELFEWFEMFDCYILILERPIPCTELWKFQEKQGYWLSESLAQHLMRQVVEAARHCCECGVLHRDIKPDNILINTDTLQLKLIDFGCGDLLQDTPYRYYSGTEDYIPPEYFCEREYLGIPATVWSLGVVLYFMVCGELPFGSKMDIISCDIQFPEGLSEDCRELILWCLERYPSSRPTFEEILSHKWFMEPQTDTQDLRHERVPISGQGLSYDLFGGVEEDCFEDFC